MHMSKLNRLKISGSYSQSDKISLFAEQLFILPELRILKLKLENRYFIPNCFKCLNNIMPFFKYFYLNYYNHYLEEASLNYFIAH